MNYFVFYLHVHSLQVVESTVEFQLYVQLQEYDNEYNLKYIPEKTAPYCCCADSNNCFKSTNTNNLTIASCNVQCPLRFTLCAELANEFMQTDEGMSPTSDCYMSEINHSNPVINFGSSLLGSHFFPNRQLPPLFSFTFKIHSPDVSICVVLFCVLICPRLYLTLILKSQKLKGRIYTWYTNTVLSFVVFSVHGI